MTDERIDCRPSADVLPRGDAAGTTSKSFEGHTRSGWAVIRDQPWHFAGLYASRQEAERKARALGDGYDVRRGVGREGTAFFRVTATDAMRG